MAMLIGIYNYSTEAGVAPNRQIQFSRIANKHSSIQAQVYALSAGIVGSRLSTVLGNQITVDIGSTTLKMRAKIQGMLQAPVQMLSNFTAKQQDALMSTLHVKKITVEGFNNEITGLIISDSR